MALGVQAGPARTQEESQELEKEDLLWQLLQFPLPGCSLGAKNFIRKFLHPQIPPRGIGMVSGWGWEGNGGSLERREPGYVGIWEGGNLGR